MSEAIARRPCELDASRLAPADMAAMREALRSAALPADDLDAPDVMPFVFRRAGDDVGYGGLELHGDNALLRSIVVDPDYRGEGVGRRIVELLSARARAFGAARAFLLTASADRWFAKFGFASLDRRDAPASIAATRQMAALCPASAVLMTKAL